MGKVIQTIAFIGMLIFLNQCGNPVVKNGQSPGNTTWYINPVAGDDNHSGLSDSSAWRTFSHVNSMQLAAGDRVEILSPGSFDQSLILQGEGSADNPVRINFAPGRYDFFTDNIYRQKYNISNTNSFPDSLKAVGILCRRAKNFAINGEGAKIVYRGKMIEVCIDSSENITIEGLKFDYHRPTVSEFNVVETGHNYADIQIHEDSKYRIEGDTIVWYGEGWISHTRILAQELNLEKNDVRRLWNPIAGMHSEEIKPGLVRLSGEHRLKKGHVYQLREPYRDYAAVFTRRSKNITFKDLNFYFLHGMGLVSQFSENLTFDNVAIAPEKNSGRTTAAWADCLHISGCKGKILVKDCTFKGAHDDAINIHGTYLQVVDKLSEKKMKLRFMHNQTFGFMAVNPGDEIEFVDNKSFISLGMNKVVEATMINPKEIIVTLAENIPAEVQIENVIENVTWTPEVEISGCHVSWIPTRGFLLSTRRKTLVEDNTFLATHMSAILIASDANKWFESGYVHDMTIRNNRFIKCAEPVIRVHPENIVSNNALHQNITIKNNEFVLRNKLILKAKSTKGILVEGNTIYSDKRLNDEMIIETDDCIDVEMKENIY